MPIPAPHPDGKLGRRRRDPMAALGEFIQRKGLKRSRQRDAIAQAFFAMGGHVPVDAVVARVREQDPRVSVATVYRTMKLLAECGLAVPRHFGEGQTRYEPSTSGQAGAHDHLICTSCGRIEEFDGFFQQNIRPLAEAALLVADEHERFRTDLYQAVSQRDGEGKGEAPVRGVERPKGTEAPFVNSLPGPLKLLTGHLPLLELTLADLPPSFQAAHGLALSALRALRARG